MPKIDNSTEGCSHHQIRGRPDRTPNDHQPHREDIPFRPPIVKSVHTAVDILGPWLQTIGWDDLHSKGCLSIEGKHILLMGHKTAEPDASSIFALGKITIPAQTGITIDALVPNVSGHQVSPGQSCFETGDKLHQMGVHTGPAVLTDVGTDRLTTIPLINMTDSNITIQPGMALGSISHAPAAAETNIVEIRPTARPQTHSKKNEYIQNLIKNAKANKGNDRINTSNFMMAQKKKWILETFKLDKKPCLQTKENLEAAVALFLKYWDLLSHDRSYRHTHLIQHQILTEDVPPIKCRY